MPLNRFLVFPHRSVILKARSLSSEDNELLVVEGINMIRDAIKLDAKMTHIYFTQRQLLKEIPYRSTISDSQIFYVTYENMKKFSNLKTPPGIMGKLLCYIILCHYMYITISIAIAVRLEL